MNTTNNYPVDLSQLVELQRDVLIIKAQIAEIYDFFMTLKSALENHPMAAMLMNG